MYAICVRLRVLLATSGWRAPFNLAYQRLPMTAAWPLCGYVERQYKFAFMFWTEVVQQVVEKISLLRASHQSCPSFGRFQEREWVLNGACPKHLM